MERKYLKDIKANVTDFIEIGQEKFYLVWLNEQLRILIALV